MAFLGHSSRIIISTSETEKSIQAWSAVGFEFESESDGRMRLTDNQVLVTLMPDEFASPGLAYFTDRDLPGGNDSWQEVQGPGGLQIYTHYRSAMNATAPTREQSPLLGYFDSLVVGVESVSSARHWAEEQGFFIQDEWFAPYPQVDVTDGLNVLSFRELKTRPFLAYSADLDRDLVRMFTELEGVDVRTFENDGNIDRVKLTMPEGTVIMVFDDSLGREDEE